ncbi:MAG: hypothetical protein A2W72_23715 [Burkholderiales bacterium RIFCSPLOWO2_12_67_14]|nr:MAG: hypothetical protein A3I64_13425 [Burkholderiales bacterium RIFCSPLOWO2_02_FULL_67_64]OGB43493.1 MAG: hypothetical protein A2W72_23715 [Burkholderiales bacterium RIFCSPLOWO2_12_67_14]OGB74605.1 MAG: hypothetical protein A3G82_13025 [Burkholderiales bacterium RIFCSPLOWO2_12_FULL_67_210]
MVGLMLGGGTPARAAEPSACPVRQPADLATLDRVHQVEEFRLFYTLRGPHALHHTQDADGNGVPDGVEDAARQLIAARRLFVEAIGLAHPLQQPRYRARAQGIDVHLLAIGPAYAASHGRAYDEVRQYAHGAGASTARCALRIDLDTRWRPPNQTPAHELFHLFQNGYTPFKVAWFTEGTARWAESALGPGTDTANTLPATPAALSALWASSYQAGAFWNRLTRLLDPAGEMPPVPDTLQAMRYTDGRPVLEDTRLHGAAFMKALLEALAQAGDRVSRHNGWQPFDWRESDQKSHQHDAELWAVVIEVVKRFPIDTPELARLAALSAGPRPPGT